MLGDLSGTQFGHMDVYLEFLEGRMLILRRSKVPFVRQRGPQGSILKGTGLIWGCLGGLNGIREVTRPILQKPTKTVGFCWFLRVGGSQWTFIFDV